MVTDDALGHADAVNRPCAVILPVEALPPGTPFTDQMTPVFVVPETLAVNCCWPKARTVGFVGVRLTVTDPPPPLEPAVTCTAALALLLESAMLVAVTLALPVPVDGGV